MAEYNHWSNTPPLRRQESRQPIQSKPSTSPTRTSHQRSASDNISVSSQSQSGSYLGFSRHVSSVSAESRRWQPVEAMGPYSPPMLSPAAWSEGGDLGSRSPVNMASPNLGSEQNNNVPQPKARPPTFHHSPSASTSASRPRPAPFQFEGNTAYYSPASSQSTFSPRGLFGHNRTNSQAHLLNTPGTNASWRSPRTPPPYSSVLQNRKRWWHWRPAWIMYVFFLCGFAFAVGHHAFYKILDGHIADDQLKMLRYGTALAFMTKACLVSAVIVAYRQRIWMTVRSKMLSVAALDSLFAATEDLSALWNLEIYKRAKVAIALAFLVWLAPLVIILTSSTLGVEPAFTIDNTTCQGVRTLNFLKEELENWRDPTRIDGLYGLSVSLWNSTTLTNTSEGWFDYYTGFSDQFEQIARMAAYGKQVVSRKGATRDICGAGWNCTYVVNFTAPGYQCKELAKGVGSKIGRFRDHDPPEGFSTKLLLPEGNYSYYAYTNGGDYAASQMKELNIGGMPPGGPPFPEGLGAFRTEPILWIGYSEQVHLDREPSRTEPGWNEAFVPKVFACENYETEYTVRFNYTGGEEFAVVTNRNFLYPVIDTKWLQGEDANDGTNDNTTAYPKSNYVYPNDDKQHYRRVAAFHSIGAMLRYFVNGTIDYGVIARTKAIQTKLVDPRRGWFPHPDLMERLQSFYEDIIFSIFSNPQFLSVVWAARPDVSSGDVAGDASTQYPCERTRFENHYRYYTGMLWGVYAGALLLAALGIASGTCAVLENEGRLRDTRFSSIVAATRGPALEKVGWGSGEDAAADLPRDVKKMRVGYGLVHQRTAPAANANALGVSTAAANTPPPRPEDAQFFPERAVWEDDVRYGFGLEGDVSQIRSEGSLFRGRSRT